MHCPGCGQQQISDQTKFCSRCGLPLGVVAEVVAHGGTLPQLAELNKGKKKLFTKKNGVVFSVFWFIFFTCFLTAFFGILEAPDAFVGILAITGVFGSLMMVIASLIFLPSSKQFYPMAFQQPIPPNAHGLYGQPQHTALPQHQSIPASVYAAPQTGNWRDTNDLLQPNSVTEGTTRLLEKEEPSQ